MQSEYFGELFNEALEMSEEMSQVGPVGLGELNESKIAELASYFKGALTPPGHMSKDEANGYMKRVVDLFGEDEIKVSLAVAGWAAIHDVGNVQDFSTKPPIVCGNKSVAATQVFGGIIPVSALGEPRQWCATMFEEHIDTVLKVFPQVKTILASRCAEAGLPASNPKAVITYLKGVTAATVGDSVTRANAKHNLLGRNMNNVGNSGAARVAADAAHLAVVEAPAGSSGHDLY